LSPDDPKYLLVLATKRSSANTVLQTVAYKIRLDHRIRRKVTYFRRYGSGHCGIFDKRRSQQLTKLRVSKIRSSRGQAPTPENSDHIHGWYRKSIPKHSCQPGQAGFRWKIPAISGNRAHGGSSQTVGQFFQRCAMQKKFPQISTVVSVLSA